MVFSVDDKVLIVCTNFLLNWYKLLIKTFTQRSHDAMTMKWTTHHFNHFTSEHYKVSKSEVLGKSYLHPIFEYLLMTCQKL